MRQSADRSVVLKSKEALCSQGVGALSERQSSKKHGANIGAAARAQKRNPVQHRSEVQKSSLAEEPGKWRRQEQQTARLRE